MNKSESKYTNTAKRMDEAFLELLGKKEFEYITVKEICAAAEVNRSTFYLHYETLNDLLTEATEYCNSRFYSYFTDVSLDVKQIGSAPLESLFLITPEYLSPWLAFIEDNKIIYQTILKRMSSMQWDKSFLPALNRAIHPILARYSVPEENKAYIMSFYLEGLNGIIKEWLKDDCRKDRNEVIRIITDCIIKR